MLLGTMLAAQPAVSATADFSTFSEPQVISGLADFADFGNGVFAKVSASGGTGQAVILNTLDPTTDCTNSTVGVCNDPDLQSPFKDKDGNEESFGNALIVQEGGGSSLPDDNIGGTLTFTFESAITLLSLVFLDGDKNEKVTITADNDANKKLEFNGIGDNTFTRVFFDESFKNITTFSVAMSGSGAIGEFSVIPLPAGFLLLLSGLGVLGFVRFGRPAAA